MDYIMTMFWDGLKKLDMRRLAPADANDLLYFIDANTAIRMSNMISGKKQTFFISNFMNTSEVFGKPKDGVSVFQKRFNIFSKHLSADVERFFVSKKSDYIFFDSREQEEILSVFNKIEMTCIVELLVKQIDGFKKIEIESLKDPMKTSLIMKFDKLKIRVLQSVPEFFRNRSRENYYAHQKDYVVFETIAKRYKRLSEIQSREQLKKYIRALKKKYHPDISECLGEDKSRSAKKKFQQINEDFDLIEKSDWFKTLPEEIK